MNNINREKLSYAIQVHNEGKESLAEKLYKEILETNEVHPDANHNLAFLYFNQNKIKEAKKYIDKVINTKYPLKEYFLTAARIYFADKKESFSLQFLDKAIDLEPNAVLPNFLKGVLYRDLGDFQNASIWIYKALEIDTENPEINNSYGVILGSLNKYQESINYFKKAITLKSDFYDSYGNLALAYHKIQSFSLARDFYIKATTFFNNKAIQKNNINALYRNLIHFGAMEQELGNINNAIKHYENAAKIIPNDPESYNNIGIALGEAGKTKDAAKFYRKSLKIDEKYYSAFRHLCTTGLIEITDPLFINMKKLIEEDIEDNNKMLIAFGLGFIYDKIGRYKDAFYFAKMANNIVDKNIDYTNDIKKILDTTPKQISALINKKIILENDYSPIFLVGMPRSGTTIVEKVLGNNDNVDEMGELVILDRLITKIVKENISWPFNISMLDRADLENIGFEYIKAVKEINPKVKNIFVDKMPSNFVHIGLLKIIFPNCKIINTNRNPYDNCMSIFLLKFSDEFRYSFNLKNLGHYYNDYNKLMNYWKKLYPEEIHTLVYEDFIENPIKETQKLFNFCNLDYKENDERFDLNKNIARTASNHQVKQKANKKSIERWKNYENELGDLIKIINLKGA